MAELNADRIALLSEALQAAAVARNMATSPVWADAWSKLERELLERLLKCEPTEDMERYRLQEAINAARRVRTFIEVQGVPSSGLERELDILEGRAKRPIA